MKRPDEHRRPYVKDNAMCRVCFNGINGCPTQGHIGEGKLCACIGYRPSMVRV